MNRVGQVWEASWEDVACLYLVIAHHGFDGSQNLKLLDLETGNIDGVHEHALITGKEGKLVTWKRLA